MHKKFCAILAAFALLTMAAGGAPAMAYSRDEVRTEYGALFRSSDELFAREPSVSAPYSTGELSEEREAEKNDA